MGRVGESSGKKKKARPMSARLATSKANPLLNPLLLLNPLRLLMAWWSSWWWGSEVPSRLEFFCASGDVEKSRRLLWRRQKSATNGRKVAKSKANPARHPLLNPLAQPLAQPLALARWVGSEVCSRLGFVGPMVMW